MNSLFQNISFIQPYFLLIGLLPFLLIILTKNISTFSTSRYCDKNLQPWATTKPKQTLYGKLHIKTLVPALAWLLLSISIAGPQIIIEQRSTASTVKLNNAVVFVLDISKSMLAQDVYPNRASKAKLIISKFLLNTKNYLSSLVVYSNNAHVVIPLTSDPNVISSVLKSIRPNMLPVEGSNYFSALALAQKQLNSSTASNKLIVLLSDGDFKLRGSDSVDKNIKNPVNTIGMGTLEGQAIPNTDGSWLTHKNQPVISKLNIVNLKKIADSFNGQYFQIKSNINNETIKSIMGDKIINSSSQEKSSITVWKQLYYWFLYPAVFLFIISTLRIGKPNAKKHKKSNQQKTTHFNVFIMVGISLLFSTSYSNNSIASALADANKQYRMDNYIKSEQLYKKIYGYNGLIGQANSSYKQKNYIKALSMYTQAIKKSESDTQRATALFNLANTYYILGDYAQSISIYKDSLLYNPYLDIAKVNLKYAIAIDEKVKRELALRLGESAKLTIGDMKPAAGSRTAKIKDGVDVGNSKLSLSNNNTKEQPLYEFDFPPKTIDKLIQRGIKHSIISSSKIDSAESNSEWNYEYTTLDMIELLVKQEKEDDFKLWKRLFEIEQGFPAPVDTPKTKEGVNPW